MTETQPLVELFNAGRFADAEALARDLIAGSPGSGFAWKLLGASLQMQGKDGLSALQKAVECSPGDAEAANNLGGALKERGRPEEAAACFRRATTLDPGYADAFHNLGAILFALNRFDEGAACYSTLLAIEPGNAVVHNNLGTALDGSGLHTEAIASYEKALSLDAGLAVAHGNLGVSLASLNRHNEAIACYRRALDADPGSSRMHSNLGASLSALNRDAEALASYDKAIAIRTDNADAQFNRALTLLRLGHLREGWMAYEKRWQANLAIQKSAVECLRWSGEPIAGGTLLIQLEQGLGDALQMLRYVPLLERLGAHCTIQAPASLASLVQRSFPNASVVARGQGAAEADFAIASMSLPLAMKTFSEADIPRAIPYLAADATRIESWKARFAAYGGPRIGLAWRGNPTHKNERNRSIALEVFAPLFTHSRMHFVTLQKGLTADERIRLARHANVTVLDTELATFDDTAAVMCTLDVVVSVDSSPAHLAGALGRPLWVMLPFSPDWRWGLGRIDSAWYPTARLFSQRTPGDWASVIDETGVALSALVRA